jgi:hypothetical protein
MRACIRFGRLSAALDTHPFGVRGVVLHDLGPEHMRQGREAHRRSCKGRNIRRQNEPDDASAYTVVAAPQGHEKPLHSPGWPLLDFSTMSAASTRIVSIALVSSADACEVGARIRSPRVCNGIEPGIGQHHALHQVATVNTALHETRNGIDSTRIQGFSWAARRKHRPRRAGAPFCLTVALVSSTPRPSQYDATSGNWSHRALASTTPRCLHARCARIAPTSAVHFQFVETRFETGG